MDQSGPINAKAISLTPRLQPVVEVASKVSEPF